MNDVRQIARLAQRVGAKVLVDGAQWVAHHRTDVRAIGCDFYVFSGHKLLGPTGSGVLWGRRELLETMPPYHGGGDMIESVTFEKTTYAALPNKFEAGTPDVAGVIGLGAAIDYIDSIGFENFERHEEHLLRDASAKLAAIRGLRIIGTAQKKGGVVSFVIEDPPMASLDVGTRLDHQGIAVRTGHHCCQPVMDRMGVTATIRASVALYNTQEEIDTLVGAVEQIISATKSKKGKPVAPASPPQTELIFPQPAAPSPAAAAEELVESFDLLGEWDDRYQFLISLGQKLPFMPPELKTEANRVRGCQSTGHLFARKRPRSEDGLDFLADSDADIVRGLVAVLQRVFAGQSAQQILSFDVESFFKRLGLEHNLSMGRRNGLASMIERLRAFARAFAVPASTSK